MAMRANVSSVGAIIEENIELLRAAKKLRKIDIAKIAGISGGSMQNRKDKPGDWTLGQLVHIAAYFGKPIEWLVVRHEL